MRTEETAQVNIVRSFAQWRNEAEKLNIPNWSRMRIGELKNVVIEAWGKHEE